MAVAEDAEQEVAPQNKKPPTEDEKRCIVCVCVCECNSMRCYSTPYIFTEVLLTNLLLELHYLIVPFMLAKYRDDRKLITFSL